MVRSFRVREGSGRLTFVDVREVGAESHDGFEYGGSIGRQISIGTFLIA